MISNYNQIPKGLNLLKHIVIGVVDRDLDSFNLSNFKLFKLYSFLKYILKKDKKSVVFLSFKEKYILVNKKRVLFFLLKEEYILVNKNNVLNNKLYYNLKFDVFYGVKTKESMVIRSKTEDYRDYTHLQFDKNLILGGIL